MEESASPLQSKPPTSLFLSHATENKPFATPLAAALRTRGFVVWYDEDELKVGQSLFAKINDGMLHSDYGVVILSPEYFSKKWTTDELRGLWALEPTQRTFVLPVWLNITHAEVKANASMLLDRFAIQASEGPERVAELIEASVSAVNVAVSMKPTDVLAARVKKVSGDLKDHAYNQGALNSIQGASRVRQSFDAMIDAATAFAAALGTPGVIEIAPRIIDNSPRGRFLSIAASFGLSLQTVLTDCMSNSAAIAKVNICLRRVKVGQWGDPAESIKLHEEFLAPFLTPESVYWKKADFQLTADDFPAYLLQFLVDQLEKDKAQFLK